MTPWTVVRQASLSMGFPRQEYWSGLPFPSPGDLPNPGIESAYLALAGRFFTYEPPEKPSWLILEFTLWSIQFYPFWQMYNIMDPSFQNHREKFHCSKNPWCFLLPLTPTSALTFASLLNYVRERTEGSHNHFIPSSHYRNFQTALNVE